MCPQYMFKKKNDDDVDESIFTAEKKSMCIACASFLELCAF